VNPNERIIRLPEVLHMVGMKKTAVYDKVKSGTVPAQLKLGRISGWLESDIQQWIGSQVSHCRDAVNQERNKQSA